MSSFLLDEQIIEEVSKHSVLLWDTVQDALAFFQISSLEVRLCMLLCLPMYTLLTYHVFIYQVDLLVCNKIRS